MIARGPRRTIGASDPPAASRLPWPLETFNLDTKALEATIERLADRTFNSKEFDAAIERIMEDSLRAARDALDKRSAPRTTPSDK